MIDFAEKLPTEQVFYHEISQRIQYPVIVKGSDPLVDLEFEVSPCCLGDYISSTEALGTTQASNGKPVLFYFDKENFMLNYADDGTLKQAGVEGSFEVTW